MGNKRSEHRDRHIKIANLNNLDDGEVQAKDVESRTGTMNHPINFNLTVCLLVLTG